MRDRHINKDNSFSLGKSMENRVEMKVLEDGLQELGEGALRIYILASKNRAPRTRIQTFVPTVSCKGYLEKVPLAFLESCSPRNK